jgi:hypothetical protein
MVHGCMLRMEVRALTGKSTSHRMVKADRRHLRVKPRGFFVYTDNIWDDQAWSDPVPVDLLGIDHDVSLPQLDYIQLTS